MKQQIIFITGTDTGVGKTVFTTLLTRHLRGKKFPIVALKPLCSGGRDDAKALHTALNGVLTLDEINPWYFRAAVSPLLAARAEKRKVNLAKVTAHARKIQKRFPLLLIEGAGGLLSPLGENFDSRDLIRELRAKPIVVAANRLGVINQLLLTLDALPRTSARHAHVVLMQQPKPDSASAGNLKFLSDKLGGDRVYDLPWMDLNSANAARQSQRVLKNIVDSLTL